MKAWLFPIIQSVFIVVLLVSYYVASWLGEQYTLRAEPFDPVDPFYGEYVLLQYPDLKSSIITDDHSIYFTLKTAEDGFAILDRVEADPFFGAIEGFMNDSRVTAPQLEQFYVEQGLGPQLEEARDLQVIIDVSSWGTIRPISLEERKE